jgi:chemotaxis protein CheC
VLLFPEEKSLELVRILLKDDLPLDILSEMEQEALTEVANIILNACLGSLSNMFQNELVYNLPVFSQGSVDSIFHLSEYNEEDLVLLLRMEFNVSHHNVNGYLSLLMDVRSVQAFSEQVAKYFGQA